MRPFSIFPTISLAAILLCSAAGCISYTTLQTPDTLPPGKLAVGIGAATMEGSNAIIEVGGRVGIAKHFDAGFKYAMPRLFFFDGKLELIEAPLTVSADLGVSFFQNEFGISTGQSTGFYPMVLIGQRHWYAGVKETYLSTSGILDMFGKTAYSGSGWLGPTVVLGGWLGNDDVRFLAEANVLFFSGASATVVPAIGLQFRL